MRTADGQRMTYEESIAFIRAAAWKHDNVPTCRETRAKNLMLRRTIDAQSVENRNIANLLTVISGTFGPKGGPMAPIQTRLGKISTRTPFYAEVVRQDKLLFADYDGTSRNNIIEAVKAVAGGNYSGIMVKVRPLDPSASYFECAKGTVAHRIAKPIPVGEEI